MLRKSFFTGTIMLIVLLFGVTNSALAVGSIRFNFKKNPWNLVKADANDTPENGKIEDGVEINQDGFILTNKKVNETKWNRLEGENYAVYKDNKITITAPAGKLITRIEFQALSQFSFDLTNDEGINKEESTDWDEDFGSGSNDPVTFKMQAQKATFTGGSSITRLVYIEVVYKDVPLPVAPEKVTTTATFDFKNDFKDSWGITNVSSTTTDELEGKIEDGKEVTQDEVTFTTINKKSDKATRVKGGTLYLPPTNTLTFKVPQGKKIKKIEFTFEITKSWLKTPEGTKLEIENKVGSYITDAQEVTFTAHTVFSKITKIVITVEGDKTTGISSIRTHRVIPSNVYDLNGVLVGTENTFNELPKGIYIINGKKVLK